MEHKNLQQRKLAIMQDAQAIDKKGYNSFSNYKYVRAVDVIEQMQKLLIKHGVLISVSENEFKRELNGKNFHTTLKCTALFINADDPKDCEAITYYSVSADTLDKDIFKAKTNGLKYLLTETFMLVTDQLIDTENDKTEKENNLKQEAKDLGFGDLVDVKVITAQNRPIKKQDDIPDKFNNEKKKGEIAKFKKSIEEAQDTEKLNKIEATLAERSWQEGEEAQIRELLFQKAKLLIK